MLGPFFMMKSETTNDEYFRLSFDKPNHIHYHDT